MIATLRLEVIGDNYARLRRAAFDMQLRQVTRFPQHATAVLDPKWRPWVAQLRSVDARGRFDRVFLEGMKDYRDANSAGSRGVYLTYVLRPNEFYEVHELLSWQKSRRFFCRAEGGKVVEMTTAEVVRQLDVRAEAIQRVVNRARRVL